VSKHGHDPSHRKQKVKLMTCLHSDTKYVREDEKRVIEYCNICKQYIEIPRELIGDYDEKE
jgi:hypothetical protein